jgi:cyclophilin family peptidyl-prolyl cis-trans isomerase
MATSKRERQKAARREKLERMQRYDKRRKTLRRSVIVGIIAVLVIGTGALLFAGGKSPATTTTTTTTTSTTSTSSTTTSTTTTVPVAGQITQAKANALAVAAGCPTSTATRVNTLTFSKAPAMTINTAKTYYAHFTTTAGSFVVKLDAATAPITTNNFVFLAAHNFYKCVIFHRVIPGFMIQGGDPTGTGTGGPGYTIGDEYPTAGNPTYPLYSIAMANQNAAHTGGSQFFIVTGAAGETLPATYSLFGQVVSGVKAVEIIQNAGNPSSTTGVPPIVTHRILNITISEQ